MELLDRIRIVMVNTSDSGNIGAAARAMKTMGLSKLCLVNPDEGATRRHCFQVSRRTSQPLLRRRPQ